MPLKLVTIQFGILAKNFRIAVAIDEDSLIAAQKGTIITIYQNTIGYISGYQKPDDSWWIEEFIVYPPYRGKGFAKVLGKYIPQHASLLAYPLFNQEGPHLTQQQLIKFYLSLGFTQIQDIFGNVIMQRG